MTTDRTPCREIAYGTPDRSRVLPISTKEASLTATGSKSGLAGVLAAAFETVAGALRDRMIALGLSRRSDRVLADMGLHRETLSAELKFGRNLAAARRGALLSQRLAAWREERRIYNELSRYSDAELAELGMGRGDVRAAARGHAVLLFRDSGLVDGHFQTDGRQTAANRTAERRAA